jgi:outer membrane protein
MIKYSTIFSLLLLPFLGVSQDNTWSLEKCISHAEKQSLTIQESQISVQQAQLTLTQDKRNRYPNLNASTGISYNVGRFVNPVTNEFVTTNLLGNNIGLNSDLTIYNGGRLQKTITRSELQKQVNEQNLAQAQQNVSLDVATAYLNILLAIERDNNAKAILVESEQQLKRINKLIDVGSLPEADKYEAEAQVARNEQSVVSSENAVEQAYLALKTILQIPIEQDFKIEQPNITIPSPESLTLQPYSTLVQRAVSNQPSIKAGELQLQSADLDVELAKVGKLPSVNFRASTGTNYANLSQVVNGTGYFGQLNENLNGSLGIFVSVPIYDRGATNTAVEQAKLRQLTQQISNRRIRQALETEVQQAFADAKAAAKQMQAAQKTLDASQKAFDNTKKRYELGSTTLLDFNTSRNNLNQAEFSVIIAKYDYIFKLKILDFYQGKKITLK